MSQLVMVPYIVSEGIRKYMMLVAILLLFPLLRSFAKPTCTTYAIAYSSMGMLDFVLLQFHLCQGLVIITDGTLVSKYVVRDFRSILRRLFRLWVEPANLRCIAHKGIIIGAQIIW